MPVKLRPLFVSSTAAAPVVVARGQTLGGFVVNPMSIEGQGIGIVETLYIDYVNLAATSASGSTFAIQPGGYFSWPASENIRVTVNANTIGHRFSGLIYRPAAGFKPSTNPFPPSLPTVLAKLIPSYLYQQYFDDDDLQAFIIAFNRQAQLYVDWFTNVNLPLYVGPGVSGDLLDWVGTGLYNYPRPSLPSGLTQNIGALNTYALNTMAFNEQKIVGPSTFYITTDDLYRRCLTWHLYKGDGKTFNVRWLKRRVMRFLTGVDGFGGETDTTYLVSITFGLNRHININLQSTRRFARGGALIGAGAFDSFAFNELDTSSIQFPVSPLSPIFKSAVEAGVLELPFQYTYSVNIN